jgi:ribosome maturation factor RimP
LERDDPIYLDIPEALRNLIEPVVEEHGCELVDVEVAQNRGKGLLRITVDSPSGDGRVPIERCASISREVETLLDAAETMPEAYQLEVSSPGLDRVLGREKDFTAAIDLEVKLRTRSPIQGRKRFRGRLLSVASGVLKMNVDGEEASIPLDEVEKAKSIYEFTSADFSKDKNAKKSKRVDSSQSG